MNIFSIPHDEYILLIGEGNFTFCTSLVKDMVKSAGKAKFPNIFATCFETEKDSFISTLDKEYLISTGITIVYEVDATRLIKHPVVGSILFHKIIFNFPHVGGKMKIHLNRKLLRDFFVSSSAVLREDGVVFVTLCAGQGGTPVDKVKRRWDDTWQVVEMAANGGFILKETQAFPKEIFKSYVSVGYRGKVKSFNTHNATVHVFTKGASLLTELNSSILNEIMTLHFSQGVKMAYVHSIRMKKNPFLNINSPQTFIYNNLEGILKTVDENYLVICDSLLYTEVLEVSNQPSCVVDGRVCYLRKNLLQVSPEFCETKHFLLKGLTFSDVTNDFTVAPAECHAAIVGPSSKIIAELFLNRIRNIFQNLLILNDCEDINLFNKSIFFMGDETKNVDINIDNILTSLFQMSWQQFWASGITLTLFEEIPVLIPPSLYPRSFTFDICLLSESKSLDLDLLYGVVQQIGCDLIEFCELLSEYERPCGNLKSYCIRFIYRSFESALSREKAISFHTNVIGKAIEQIMNVKVV